MEGASCQRKGCNGIIEDSYCNVCGHAETKNVETRHGTSLRASIPTKTVTSPSASTTTGSSPLTNRSKGSRRTSHTSKGSSRKQLGAGLVSVPELPSTEPEKAIMAEAKVPQNKRFCSNCNNSLNREKGFCPKCGQKYSFIPSLQRGDLVVGQYEVKGAIAYGGLGWIYLGFDKTLSRYVVLKGLLNSEDAASAAVAVAERQFLAAVKHANIVGIYNFVNHGSEGFIVMEYVGGKTLKEIRKERGPLPVGEAIAYIHRILSAFAYLHSLGLVYCDFKPDNVMLEDNDVKLIDLGGVRRIDDPDGDIYGTVGYSAPEAGEGPTVVSDLFTIGRTLAVLLTNIKGFSKEHLHTLPSPQEEPLFAQQESLYRFLLKATAANPDERFQSADEMAEQLLGVLREIVATETNTPRPASSKLFGGDMLALTNSSHLDLIKADYHQLPMPMLDTTEPGFNAVLNASAIADPYQRVTSLRHVIQQFPDSSEALLRLANSLIDTGSDAEVEEILQQVEQKDPWDWRVLWYRGRSLMAQSKAKEAQATFDQVYFDLPGELVPKLALGLAAESAGNFPLAIHMYDIVSSTDPNYISAAFGLARCRCATGDRKGAVAALERVPPTANLYTRSRVEIARSLIDTSHSPPGAKELQEASTAIEALTIKGMERYQLTKQVLETALYLLTSQVLSPTNDVSIMGQSLQEVYLRKGLEKALRDMAHLSTADEKIRLVDEANRVRPKTLF
ncbi:serine/threonine-protein kinase [Iningainema tapete]|uniref:Serine/threonine-protein kinase PknG n=1 Tax=Iningainema tapete BLCC-T55 TaxID=2748662 RepID=A0A8J7CAQ4_9CYAN|nr:serine/threonine-protein kinase [Iningainema tapete]MBD2777406.1 protein kinase [Iningainema tapete BLCC-T55]